MDKKCSKYESLFVFSDEETLSKHLQECEDCRQEQEKMNNEIKRCENMLKNESFISKAPAQKVEQEKQKLAGYQARLEEIKKLLADL